MQITQLITTAQPPGVKKPPENSKACVFSPDMFTAILSALQLQSGIQADAAVDVLSSETCPDGPLLLPGADLCQYSALPYGTAGFTLPEMAASGEPGAAEAATGATIHPVPVEQVPEIAVPVADLDGSPGQQAFAGENTKAAIPQVQTDGEPLSAKSADGSELSSPTKEQPAPATQETIWPGSETANDQAFTGAEKVHLSKLSRENGSAEPPQKKDVADGIPPEKSSYPARAALETPAAQFGRVNVARAEVVEQVVDKMVFSKDFAGESSVFIRLKPAVLGQVEIRLSLQDGQLTASIMTGSTQVKDALEGAMAQLRQRLESQQIHVAELTVFVGEEYRFTHDQGSGNMYRQNETPRMHGRLQREGGEESPGSSSVISGLVNTLA